MLTELFIDLALAERKAAIGRNKFATLAEIGQRIVVASAAGKIEAALGIEVRVQRLDLQGRVVIASARSYCFKSS